jgi:hypothetical protein
LPQQYVSSDVSSLRVREQRVEIQPDAVYIKVKIFQMEHRCSTVG